MDNNYLVYTHALSATNNGRLSTFMCEYLDTGAVSEETGIPAATLRYWRHANVGPASFTLGRRVVYRRGAIKQWIADQEQATTRGGAT